jgi:hypothetical protein
VSSGDDAWLFTANVAYENLRDERLQAGGGGEASGVVPIPQQFPPPSTRSKTTFFERNFDEWAGSVGLKHKPSGLFRVGIFSTSSTDDTNAVGFFTHRLQISNGGNATLVESEPQRSRPSNKRVNEAARFSN